MRRDEKKLSRKVFQMIDYGGHGTVDPVALKRFMESTGVHVTMEQAENFVATADRYEAWAMLTTVTMLTQLSLPQGRGRPHLRPG